MEDIRITRTLRIPAGEIRFRFSRSSGPGGQNVNRRATRVEISFDVAGSPSLGPRQRARVLSALSSRIDTRGTLRIAASEERTQQGNRARAVERFRALLAAALRPGPPPRRPTRPSAASEDRRIAAKRRRTQVKRGRTRPDPGDW